ncbi:MAG TPA: DsbC family protein [Usitatibacter sp.]|nr:DsbC family protein [Usitatibacter sp.]
MSIRTRIFASSLVALAFAVPAVAADDADKVKAALMKAVPEVKVDSVRKTQYFGLYEVIVGGDIFYTDDKAEFLVMGSIMNLKTKENMTELRQRQLNKVAFADLPLDSAFKIVRGNGSRKVAMFADPNCGYCKRFERDLLGVNDITVYVFLYPILSPDSVEKSKGVWCSADKGKAWIDWMVRDVQPPADAKCTTPLDKNLAYGQSKRVTGTPTMIFEDGERIPGAMAIADFEKRLAAAKLPAPTASAK